MTISRRLWTNIAAVGVLWIVTVGWVVMNFLGGGVSERFRLVADFASTGGVFTAQEVTYRGVLIGRVGELTLNDDGVDVELDIDPEWDGKIPEQVLVTVQSKSAVGEQFVNLVPLVDSGPMLADGDVIPRERTSLPVDFQELLTSLDRVLADVPPGRTRRLVQNLAGGIAGRSEEIATILRSLGTLSETFASVSTEQSRLLDSSTRAGRAFLASKDEFERAIEAADEVLAGIGDEPEELRALLASNDRFAREGILLLARHGRNLRAGISALADFVGYQLSEKNEILKSLEYTPQFLKAVEEASVPWRSPDGRRFYRIRVGLVYDNVESTWPCKYVLPEGYERQAHFREERPVNTNAQCVDLDATAATAAEDSLLTAMKGYIAEDTVRRAQPVASGESSEGGFIWPVEGTITSPFGDREGEMHWGIDIGAARGAPVVASARGIVSHAGAMEGFGRVVIVDHGGGVETLYAHLSDIPVAFGQPVVAGELIGSVGCSGECTGEHLHFEVHVNNEAIDPLTVLPGGPLFTPA